MAMVRRPLEASSTAEGLREGDWRRRRSRLRVWEGRGAGEGCGVDGTKGSGDGSVRYRVELKDRTMGINLS
jgi:hypothetical protein